jgi:uncharacterized GH25 family protein
MVLSLVVVGGVVVLAVILAVAGNRGAGLLIALLALLLAGGAALFLLGSRAPTVTTAPGVPARVVPVHANPVPTVPVPEAVPTRSVRGRVLKGAEGEVPFPGTSLQAGLESAGAAGFDAPLATAVAGEDGKFTLEGLPQAGIRIRATAPGHAVPALSVAAEFTGEVTIRLFPGAAISGRVLDRETKAPVAGAEIAWERTVQARSGPDGAFRLDAVTVGSMELVVRAKGYARRKEVVTVPEAGRGGLEILLRPGSSVSGTVFGPDGKPRAGASIDAVMLYDAPIVGETPVPLDTGGAVSGPDGNYSVDGLPAARKLRISASTEDMLAAPVDAGPLAKGVPQEGVDLKLAPAGTIIATVLDGKGNPVPGATVTATPAEGGDRQGAAAMIRVSIRTGQAGTPTDERGIARVRPVVPGPMTVRAAKDDYKGAETPLLTGAGAETPVTLVLDAGQSLSGKVVDGGGAPVPGATVTVQHLGIGSAISEQRTTAEDGTFRVGGIDGRGFMVRAEKKGFVTTSLNNQEAGKEGLVVTLQLGGTVVGVVTDATGSPVGQFRVLSHREGDKAANPMDWQRFASALGGVAFDDPAGKFRLDGLDPGTYTFEGRSEGLAPGRSASVAVQAGKETEVSIQLPVGLALAGVVVRKSDGSPVEGARVKVPADGPFGEFDMGDFDLGGIDDVTGGGGDQNRQALGGFAKATVRTGADGRFTLPGLEAGGVRLMVSAKGLSPATVRGVEVPGPGDLRVELGEEAAVEGVVTDSKGAPKEGAMIMVQRMPVTMRYGRTDAQGHYRIGGLSPGSVLFYCMEGTGAGGPGLNLKSDPLVLEEGKTTRKDYRFGEGTKVVGRVTRGGKPVTGAMVMLFPASRSAGPTGMLTGGGGGGFAMASTKDDGNYEISGVNPGRYTSTVQSGFGGAPGGGEPFEVGRGVTEVRHDIVLPDTGIRGIVVDEEGKAVPGAAVTALDPSKATGKLTDIGSAMESVGGQGFTDDEGRFAISGMKAGSWRLHVQAQGYGTEVLDNVAAVDAGSPEVRVTLHQGTEVIVRVVGPDGSPVRGANVFLSDSQGRELTNLRQMDTLKTGEDGRASVRAPAGSLKFEAAAQGFAPGETTATVPTGGEVVVKLAKAATLKVTVSGPGGAPLAGAGVELLDPSGVPFGQRFSMDAFADMLGSSATGSDGTLVRKNLPAGPWRVRAALTDGRSGEEKVTLVEGETTEVAISVR